VSRSFRDDTRLGPRLEADIFYWAAGAVKKEQVDKRR
jgi:hypothetical protein